MTPGQLDFTEHVYWGLRIVAGLVGAVLGWYASGPLTRLAYRLSFRRPIPGWLLPWGRLGGAVGLGLLAYFLIPLGGAGGGLGWGAGLGAGPGKGPGEGGDVKERRGVSPPVPRPRARSGDRDVVEVEILGGMNYPGEQRYYLLNRTGPPRSLDEVRDFLAKQKGRVEVHIVLTEQSVAPNHGAVLRLRELLDKENIPTVETVEG